jgi:hypothetical protein
LGEEHGVEVASVAVHGCVTGEANADPLACLKSSVSLVLEVGEGLEAVVSRTAAIMTR